ncbi:unnamed protein product, partial [Rotaria magnacalcarata]
MRMPRALVENSHIDVSTGQITMRRSHPWINNFNEWVISACRCNMDIKFIWTGSDAKALVYYIADYVTKSSLAFYDMFALAQRGIKSIEQQQATCGTESAIEKSRKLVLRCYNTIASHQEVSGVQVASYLMNYGDHYTTHTFRNIFLISIENYLQAEIMKVRLSEKDIDEEESDELSIPSHEDQEDEAKETEEQFILEPTKTKSGHSYVMVNTRLDYQHRSKDLTALWLYEFISLFHKKVIDKSDRRLLANAKASDGERLSIEGTKMNERHTFASLHPQSSSHTLIKHTNPVVPVLLGPQIPRREREDTRERYCRALLTLFVPWRSLLHECKSDRDEHPHQVITEAQTNIKIDPILIPSCYEIDGNNPEDDSEELVQMLSLVSESTIKAYSASLSCHEQCYLFDALEAIDKTTRFGSLNDYKNLSNKNFSWIADDFNTFIVADSHHGTMREDSLEVRNGEVQVEGVTSEIPTSPFKMNIAAVPPVTTTIAISLPTKYDI